MNSTAVMDRYYLQRVIIYIRHLMLSQQWGTKKTTTHMQRRKPSADKKKKKKRHTCAADMKCFSSNIGPIPSSKRLSPS